MAPSIYHFHLTVEPNGTDYQVRFECQDWAGQSRSFHVPRTLVEQARGFGLELCQGRLTDNARAARYGELLYKWFFVESVGPRFQDALAKVRKQSGQLRLCIRYHKDELLHEVPWELLCDRDEYLALNPDVLLTRYLCMEKEVRSMAIEGPAHLLMTTAGLAAPSANAAALNLDAERQQIVNGLQAEPADAVAWKTLEHVNASQLRGAFLGEQGRAPIHVWHHAGHGQYDEARKVFHLVLENQGREEFLPAASLAEVVAQCASLRLVVLNVCHGSSSAGLASALAELNVPAVIGHRTRIEDWSAIRFTQSLYANLLHAPVDHAVREARRSLQTSRRTLDWALPILFLRTLDAVLVPSRPTTREITDFSETTPEPPAKPVATAPETISQGKSTYVFKFKKSVVEEGLTFDEKANSGHETKLEVDAEETKLGKIDIREDRTS